MAGGVGCGQVGAGMIMIRRNASTIAAPHDRELAGGQPTQAGVLGSLDPVLDLGVGAVPGFEEAELPDGCAKFILESSSVTSDWRRRSALVLPLSYRVSSAT